MPGARSPASFRDWVDAQFDPSVTWEDIEWVRSNWRGRLVVKGVLDPEDARRAVDAGVDGIVVSNHGGRQLDSVRRPSCAAGHRRRRRRLRSRCSPTGASAPGWTW